MPYCNATTDLYRIYPGIEDFKQQKTLRGWVVHSGDVYKISNVGYGETLFENNLQLIAVASIAAILAGKYFYDADTDIIYVQPTSGTAAQNAYKWGNDWDALKTWAVTRATERVEAILDRTFPIPIPENPYGTSTAKWDGSLIDATAYIACSLISGRREPAKFNSDGSGANLTADLFVSGKSIVDQYNKGELHFSWQITSDEIAGYNVIPTNTNTSIGMFQLRGEYTGEDDAVWKIKITLAGALGTAKYALSKDNGLTYATAILTSITWTDLGGGIEIRFFERGGGSLAFILNDSWQIDITSKYGVPSQSRMGTVDLIA